MAILRQFRSPPLVLSAIILVQLGLADGGTSLTTSAPRACGPVLAEEQDPSSALHLLQKRSEAKPSDDEWRTKAEQLEKEVEHLKMQLNEKDGPRKEIEKKAAVASVSSGSPGSWSLLQQLKTDPLFGRAAKLYTDYTFNRTNGTTTADVLMISFLVMAVMLNICLVATCWVLARAGDKAPGSSLRILIKAVEKMQKEEERSNWLAAAAKYGLEAFDRSKTGVELSIASISVNPAKGSIELADVAVVNPELYKTPFVMRLNRLTLLVNMDQLISSAGAVVEVTQVILDDISVVVEQANGGVTNIEDIMVKLVEMDFSGEPLPDKQPQEEDEEKRNAELAKLSISSRLKGRAAKEVAPPGPPKLMIRAVEVKNITAKAGWLILATVARKTQVPGIAYQDFEREVVASWREKKVENLSSAIVPFFVMTLARTVAQVMSLPQCKISETLYDMPLTFHKGEHDVEKAAEASAQPIAA